MTDGRINSEWLTSAIPSMQQLGDARLRVHRCRPLIRGGCCQFVVMAFGISKGMLIPLMVLNFCLYLIASAIAGSVFNRNLDASAGLGGTNPPIGNVVTPVFIIVTLIACMVGLASVLAGLHHIRVWRTESLAGAAATSVIAWLLTLLAMGISSKEIHTGYGRSKRLKVVEAFMIILSLTELLYLLALHAGTVTNEGYANAPGHRAVNDPKFGTPAATAV